MTMRKFYVDPKKYGAALAESIAQTMHSERPATAGYAVGVSPHDVTKDKRWEKHAEELDTLKKREAELAKAKGWSERQREEQARTP